MRACAISAISAPTFVVAYGECLIALLTVGYLRSREEAASIIVISKHTYRRQPNPRQPSGEVREIGERCD